MVSRGIGSTSTSGTGVSAKVNGKNSMSATDAKKVIRENYGEMLDALSKSWSEVGLELQNYENGEYLSWSKAYFKEKRTEYLNNLNRSLGVSDYDKATVYANKAVEKHQNTKKLQSLRVSEKNAQSKYEKAMERVMTEYEKLLGK